MRKGSTVHRLVSDHLGGTALTQHATNSAAYSAVRYHPYGTAWTQEGDTPTDKLFTGQRRYGAKSGIYHYGARFYSADIGRFLSADTIVPGAENPQALTGTRMC
jgi:RHS repeat-associated protein